MAKKGVEPHFSKKKKKGVEPHFSKKGRNQIPKNAVRPLFSYQE